MRHTPRYRHLSIVLGLALALPTFAGPVGAQTRPEPQTRSEPERDAGRKPGSGLLPGQSAPRGAEPPRSSTPAAPKPSASAKKKPQLPDTPEARERALANLYAHLATAADPGEATAVATAIEMLWGQSGSDTVGLLLTRATQATIEKKSDLARALFDAVVDLAPDFAEGFARRAFFHYSENDTTSALGDLRRALALEPNHFRALDGLSAILNDIGEKRAALQALKQLEMVHPHWPGLDDALKEMERAVEGQGI